MRPPSAATPTAALAAVVAILFATPAVAVEGPWQENPESRVRLVSPYAVAPATGPWQLGLEFEMQPGWHVYWKNSGDAGYPPVLDFAATPGAGEVEMRWPAPERYLLPGDLEALGYEGQVIYPLALAIEPDGETGGAAGGTVTLAADLDYLVCEVDCIPYRYRLTLDQPVAEVGGAAVADPAAAPRLAAWQARLPRTAGALGVTTEAAVDVSAPSDPVLQVRVGGGRAALGAEPDLFLEADERFDFGVPRRVETPGGEILFHVPARFWQVPDPMPAAVELAWTVTGLGGGEDGEPLAVEARQPVPIGRGGLAPPADGGGRPSLLRLVALLAGALAGGLILHLTPTLLPLAVVRGMEIAAEREPAAARRAALATAAGAFAGALGLGALTLAFRATGQAVTWGSQLQEPAVVALLALAATFLALDLWGLFRWPLRLTGSAETLPPERSPAMPTRGAAVGLATAVLALPWSLPPLPESIGPALAAGPAVGLAAFAAFGGGLALPWLVVAAAPGLVSRLPHAAAGGVVPVSARRLAEGLGFLAAGGVVWLLYLLSRQLRSDGLALLELVLLTLALVAWVRATARRRLLAAALAVVLAGLAVAAVWVADARRLVPRAAADPPDLNAGVRPTVNAGGGAPVIAAGARPASAPSDHSSP
jgi:suppressor for copper-sensitivity B